MDNIYEFAAARLDGAEVPLASYAGQVLLIVNTASKCGFTPQYAELEQLYEAHRADGLAVLGFPCNQFGKQEPGNASEIGAFCIKNYGVSFAMFAKVDVNGNGAHPLYKYLTNKQRGVLGTKNVKWNFTKFLVNRAGDVVARFAPWTKPAALEPQIARLLAEN